MTDKNTAALAAHHPENHLDMVGRWYMVNKMGMATLCVEKEDAEQEAADAQMAWPHMGPHRAVRLVEASFEAHDVATASAEGFRAGQDACFQPADVATAAADGYRSAAAELAKLRGQRMVLCSLLDECRGHLADAADAMYTLKEEMPVRHLVEVIELTLNALAEEQVMGGES